MERIAPEHDRCCEPGFVIVVPTYNHRDGVAAVLDGLVPLGLPIIIVDDGSTDDTLEVLDLWQSANSRAPITRIRHSHNRGKADALRTGFAAAAMCKGVTHAVTIDSDGQLDPADIPLLLAHARQEPDALIIGTRPARMANCPRRCEIGRCFASLAVLSQTGRRLADTQCGLRVYPLALTQAGHARAGRYAFEAEIIARALWSGFGIIEVPVRCTYRAKGDAGRVSYFRPFVDSIRQLVVHGRLIVLALLPWTRSRARPTQPAVGILDAAFRAARWLNPARCILGVRSSSLGKLELAAALGIGVWIGTLPFFGFHTAMCLYVAWKLNLHPAATVLGSQVSIPPVGIALGVSSIWVGHFLLTGRAVGLDSVALTWMDLPRITWQWLPAWTLGGVIIGFILGFITFAATIVITATLHDRSPSRP